MRRAAVAAIVAATIVVGTAAGAGASDSTDAFAVVNTVIGQLARGPSRFTDIAKPFDLALNAVTKHLKLLERAGLIARKRQGREVLISFRPEPLRLVAGWVHEYEKFWNERLDEFEGYFKEKRERKKKP